MRTQYIKCKICHRKGVAYIFDKNLKDEDNDGMWKMVCKHCGFTHLPSKVKLQICMRTALEVKQLGL